MEKEINISRRKFLGAAAGAAGAAAALSWPASRAIGGNEPLRVPKENIGTILFTQRDRISAAPDTSGVPYGFAQVLAALATQGYKTIEFAGYNQSTQILGRQITPAEIRAILDANGLDAKGNHGNIPGTLTDAAIATFKANCQIALTLGQEYIGTGDDPTGSHFKADWDLAVERWATLGDIAKAEGLLGVYNHNHDNAYNFLLDSGPLDALGRPTRSSGDPQGRVLHQGDQEERQHDRLHGDGHLLGARRAAPLPDLHQSGRRRGREDLRPGRPGGQEHAPFPLFHAKDGRRTADPPGVGSGYTMVPFGTGDIDFKTFFDRIGANRSHYPMYEQDNAPGGSANPGQSLAFSQVSYNNMAALGPVGS